MGRASARGAEEAIRRAGGVGKLPIIDGPHIEKFDPKMLAKALEQEIQRCGEFGWSKVSLHMDVQDAFKLAKFLRGK